MKTILTLLVAVSCLCGSLSPVMARTSTGERFDAPAWPPILQNRDCKGDKDDHCR